VQLIAIKIFNRSAALIKLNVACVLVGWSDGVLSLRYYIMTELPNFHRPCSSNPMLTTLLLPLLTVVRWLKRFDDDFYMDRFNCGIRAVEFVIFDSGKATFIQFVHVSFSPIHCVVQSMLSIMRAAIFLHPLTLPVLRPRTPSTVSAPRPHTKQCVAPWLNSHLL